MSSSIEKNLIAEIELLKLALNEKQVENQLILNRKDELEESLIVWQEKFQRLYESHKRVQNVNQNLEEKLLRLVDENTRQRAKLNTSCASLNIRLNKSNARIIHLQNEIERYKKDISLAINLLRLNPESFVPPNFSSLPHDTQSKLCQFIKKSSSDDIDNGSTFRGYKSIPMNDPIYHSNDHLSPITVSKFLESELKRNVGIQTNSANLFGCGTSLKEISHDENFVHHEKCDRVKMNANKQNDCLESKKSQNNTGARSKETKQINIKHLKENNFKQFEHFLSFVKNKSNKNPRICAVRINDDGIYLDLDNSQELFIKTSTSDSEELVEKTECTSPIAMHDETYSVNKTDSEKFNEIKSSSHVDTSSQCSNENAFKHQRVAEWLNASIQIEDKPKENCKNSFNTKETVDLLQMEYNVHQFMLNVKQQNEWKQDEINDDFCKSINENSNLKLHRTETNL
ncbi:hypothetical protein PVAND_005528 [Polypedilum vanderplanki]|uniref:Tight junction-associated protein 1 n=1 Tax=Polypedilum vanderplanki TaxID=319348 RepID=A0A9J6C164_POLVA|nr:hypothetical protein PVAND_005528 [Polypedilum vanderplanki]